MKRVRMKTLSCGPNGTLEPGQEVPMSDEEAKATVEGGYGEYVEETATAEETTEAKATAKSKDKNKNN
ncbi:MAG: hypothetical protein ACYC3E_00040 [Carboxydocellales bacterium]